MKKMLLATCLIITLFLFTTPAYGGLVPCGTIDDPNTPEDESQPCQLCHLFVMINRIVEFVLTNLVPPIAILMLVVGGTIWLTSGGNPEQVASGKKLITSVVIGLIIIFGSWIFLSTFLQIIGVAEWTGLKTWWEIKCP
ncbi:hypothetical protein J7L36_01530 [bacterium]|nr:hypothetical protein [bacterium]